MPTDNKQLADDVKNMISSLVSGIKIKPNEQETLVNLYVVKTYELLYKTLLNFQLTDQEFINESTNLFNNAIQRLTPTQKGDFEEAFAEEKRKLLHIMFTKFANSLGSAERDIIRKNLQNLIQ